MENITDNIRIKKILTQLLEQRTLITASIDGHTQEYSTTLADLTNEHEEQIILNEFRPIPDDELYKSASVLKLAAQVDGVPVDFNIGFKGHHKINGIAHYRCTLPTSLNYHQRRASIRVPLSPFQSVPATLTTPSNLILTGDIADLSIGGIRVRFSKELPVTLETDQILYCSFPLPPDGKQPLTCQIVVRAVKKQSEKIQPAFIGGQFVSVTTLQERQIERSVMLLQRLAQQKRNS